MQSSGIAILLLQIVGVTAVRRDLVEKRATGEAELQRVWGESKKTGRSASALQRLLSLQGFGLTPGVAAQLKKVQEDLDGAVSTSIINAHNGANSALAKKVDILQTNTEDLARDYGAAKTAHSTWVGCIGDEKTELSKFEDIASELINKRKIAADKLKLEKAAEPFKDTTTSLKFRCNVVQSPTCLAEFEALKAAKAAAVADVKKHMDSKASVYDNAKSVRESADANVTSETKKYYAQYKAYQRKGEECDVKLGERNNRVCNDFGVQLVKKCQAFNDYTTTKGKIDQAGNALSHADRVSEWASTKLASCLIGDFLNNVTIDAETIAKCKGQTSFDRQIDYQTTRVDGLMTEKDFSCQEKTITWSGDWKHGDASSAGIQSTKFYKKIETWVTDVDLSRKDALPFCAEA